MDARTKLSAKQNAYISNRLYQKKSVLYSSDDLIRMAEHSSKARLIQQIVGTSNTLGLNYQRYLSDLQNLHTPHVSFDNGQPKRNEYVAAYPSRVGLRWNPCVEVSSGEDIPMDSWAPKKTKSVCNCAHCTAKSCPSKKSFTFPKYGFRDNIVRFSDKCTMTPKLNHAGCSTGTPSLTPKMSDASVTASNSQSRFNFRPSWPKSIFKKSCLKADSDTKPGYDEAVRDTDKDDDATVLQKAFSRLCVTNNSECSQPDSGKINLYNEGISDKIAERFPVSPPNCPHKIRYGGRTFCKNKCNGCSCRRPNSRTSKYHQRCKLPEFSRPVFYDVEPEEGQRFVAIPDLVADRSATSPVKTKRTPSITLPKKVLTSERDIEAFIKEQSHEKARNRCDREMKNKIL